MVGVGGLLGHLAGGVDWNLLAAGCAGAVPGAYLGAHLTGRLDDHTLLQAIAAILVIAGYRSRDPGDPVRLDRRTAASKVNA